MTIEGHAARFRITYFPNAPFSDNARGSMTDNEEECSFKRQERAGDT